MKKTIIFLILCAVIMNTACKSNKLLVTETSPPGTIEKRITTLVPVYLPEDSSLMKAYLECDSMNRVIMKGFSETKSGRIESTISLNNNELRYRIRTIRDTVYIPSDTIFLTKNIPFKIETTKIVYRMSSFQRVFFWTGIGVALLLLIYLSTKINYKSLITFILKTFKL